MKRKKKTVGIRKVIAGEEYWMKKVDASLRAGDNGERVMTWTPDRKNAKKFETAEEAALFIRLAKVRGGNPAEIVKEVASA